MKDPSKVSSELIKQIAAAHKKIQKLERLETEHKHTEEALRRSEMKFRTLYNSTSDAVMLLDKKGFFDCNGATLMIFGCATLEEFRSMTPADLSPPVQPCGTDSVTLSNRHISLALKQGRHQFEWLHKRADTGVGFPADVLLTAMVLDGRPVLQAVVRDITDRKHAENALRESEQKFKDLSEKSIAGIYLIQDGVFKYVNMKLARTLGYKVAEMIDKVAVKDVVFSEDWPALNENVFKRLRSTQHEFRVITKNKKIKNAEIYSSRTTYRGKPATIGTYLDITERKRMENALRESEARLRSITDSARSAIIMIDPGGAISFWNPAAEVILGYRRDEVIGKDLHQLLAPERYLEEYRSAFSEFALTGRGNAIGKTLELAAIRKDGREIPVELSLSVVSTNDKPHAVGILRDITDRKQAEEEKKHNERFAAALEMAGTICHELNQPLQVIGGCVDLLNMKVQDKGTLKTLRRIKDQVHRVGAITQQLMGLKKYSNRDYVGTIKITDIREIPEDMPANNH